jgi:hypothetical protein
MSAASLFQERLAAVLAGIIQYYAECPPVRVLDGQYHGLDEVGIELMGRRHQKVTL